MENYRWLEYSLKQHSPDPRRSAAAQGKKKDNKKGYDRQVYFINMQECLKHNVAHGHKDLLCLIVISWSEGIDTFSITAALTVVQIASFILKVLSSILEKIVNI